MLEDFKVKTGEFEGPLHLLLDLIEKRKLHVSQVSLSQVADEFIEHTKSFENFPIKDSAEFILIASTLLLIKSKSLLPNLNLSESETQSIDDLEKRLEQYRKYRELGRKISKIFGNNLYFARDKKQEIVFMPSSEINIENLERYLSELLLALPKKESLPKIAVAKIISLEEMIAKLSERIEKNLRMGFRHFSGIESRPKTREEKINVIISFLAMLELVKRGAMRVRQSSNFEEIEMETSEVVVPKY
jgi:segregation and condensation protein A